MVLQVSTTKMTIYDIERSFFRFLLARLIFAPRQKQTQLLTTKWIKMISWRVVIHGASRLNLQPIKFHHGLLQLSWVRLRAYVSLYSLRVFIALLKSRNHTRQVYSLAFNADIGILGTILFIVSCFDTMVNPFVGYIQDNEWLSRYFSRDLYGRRAPFYLHWYRKFKKIRTQNT